MQLLSLRCNSRVYDCRVLVSSTEHPLRKREIHSGVRSRQLRIKRDYGVEQRNFVSLILSVALLTFNALFERDDESSGRRSCVYRDGFARATQQRRFDSGIRFPIRGKIYRRSCRCFDARVSRKFAVANIFPDRITREKKNIGQKTKHVASFVNSIHAARKNTGELNQ